MIAVKFFMLTEILTIILYDIGIIALIMLECTDFKCVSPCFQIFPPDELVIEQTSEISTEQPKTYQKCSKLYSNRLHLTNQELHHLQIWQTPVWKVHITNMNTFFLVAHFIVKHPRTFALNIAILFAMSPMMSF